MKLRVALFGIFFALTLLLLPGLAQAQGQGVVSGTLTYRDRSALPPNAVVTVQIAEVRPGVMPQVIAEQRFTSNNAQPPFRYTIGYDPARIDLNAQYTVQSNITVGGQVRYTTNQIVPVITRGAPTMGVTLNLVLVGALPEASSGSGWLLFGLVALAGAGVAALGRMALRRELTQLST
ncbi:YbaY family lipoprotein [Candidatus Chloroploca sp. Khr17]|uniref:YbaY family lipoprotein n=1 Tax=Candidatus Chloroploca sp. Khr17 TaxID=2496869 RepID=UPI00101D1213|nr:YbaY family lipoprotein [Candidatus Chloroploca sp. Khr17]